MVVKMGHYKVREGALAIVRPAIEAFVQAIAREEPHTRYEAYQAEDELSFVHLMMFPDASAEQAPQQAAHTLAFVEVLYPNCENPPTFTKLQVVKTTLTH